MTQFVAPIDTQIHKAFVVALVGKLAMALAPEAAAITEFVLNAIALVRVPAVIPTLATRLLEVSVPGDTELL